MDWFAKVVPTDDSCSDEDIKLTTSGFNQRGAKKY
jgi:hypothetical protein